MPFGQRMFGSLFSCAKRDTSLSLLLLPALYPLISVASFVCVVLWMSFQVIPVGTAQMEYSLANYHDLLFDGLFYDALKNTLIFSIAVTLAAMPIGLGIAWLCERTSIPHKELIYFIMVVGLLVPGIYTAMGWTFLAHPRVGWVNQLLNEYLGFGRVRINVLSPFGMGLIQGLNLAPLSFILTSQMFRAINPLVEEAAEVHGLSFGQTVRYITLPLAWPGILGASIYIFAIGFAAFDIPAIMGLGNRIYLLSTYVFMLTNAADGLPQYGVSAAVGTFMIVVALGVTWWYTRVLSQAHRYQTITGKGYRPKVVALRKRTIFAAWVLILLYALLSKVLPFLLLVFVAFSPWVAIPSLDALSRLTLLHFKQMNWQLVLTGLRNSAILMLLVPLAVVALAFLTSWLVVRWRSRFRQLLELGAFLPHVLPDVILAVGASMFALFVVGNVLPLYGSVWIILLVYIIIRMPFATRAINGPLVQIHAELEEAAHVSGLSLFNTFRRILAPLLARTLLMVWIWTALLVYRELTVAAFLVGPNNVTLSVVIWNFWLAGGVSKAAAVSLIMAVGLMPLVALWWRLGARITA